jgi:hypothetical protein
MAWHGMAWHADGEDNDQIWKIAAKQSQNADKGCASSLGIGQEG